MAPSHRLFVWGQCYRRRKLTQGDSTLVAERASYLWQRLQPQPSLPRVPRAGQPPFLSPSEDGARPRIGHCGQVWEFLGFRQARSLSVAPMTPRQPDLRLCQFYSHCSREGQYFPKKDLLFPRTWFSACAGLPWNGPSTPCTP